MNQNVNQFKRTATRAGASLLIFLGFFELASLILTALRMSKLDSAVFQIIYGIVYLAIFMIPAFIFRKMNKDNAIESPKLFKAPPKTTPLIIFAGIALCLSCAYVNSIMLSFFDGYEEFAEGLIETDRMGVADTLALAFSTALVPAICEEYFFRRSLLDAILPYGEGVAIFSTAILFGLMHQNIAQIFYTVMAGLVLGYAYVKTRSYLCVFLIHFVNNLISVIQQAITTNMQEPLATALPMLIYAVVLIAGSASLILLAIINKKKKDIYSSGSFGVILDPSPNYKEKPLPFDAAKKLFKSPTVLIYVIICILTCVLQLLMILFPAK